MGSVFSIESVHLLPSEDWRWLVDRFDMSRAYTVEPDPERVAAFFAYRDKHRKEQDRYPRPGERSWGTTRRQAVRVWARIVRASRPAR